MRKLRLKLKKLERARNAEGRGGIETAEFAMWIGLESEERGRKIKRTWKKELEEQRETLEM